MLLMSILYTSGTDAYFKHMHQLLRCMFSISVKIQHLKRSLKKNAENAIKTGFDDVS
jgi:hypothetical protein